MVNGINSTTGASARLERPGHSAGFKAATNSFFQRCLSRSFLFCLFFIGLVLIAGVFSPSVFAEDRSISFLKALRERNYFDYANLYLDQLAKRTSVPDEIRKAIPYERAITLKENAKILRNPEKQFELLDQSMAYLEQFTRDNPGHPLSAEANSDRAQILLQKAEVEILQSKLPANKSSKGEFLKRGREFVTKARSVVKLAFEQHTEAAKQFPSFIDPQKDPQRHAERDALDRSLILESLALAKCTYLEARTFEPATREFKELLSRAADEFEKIFNAHSNQVGGLHARLWQGKCFEERGDQTKALGFYNDVLKHEGTDASLLTLQSQALLFKLGCMQTPENYQALVDLAEEWLKKKTTESKSQIGLGIQWEQARAWESMGDNRSIAKSDQERFWRQARSSAQLINRFAGEYKDLSQAMLQRLQTKLGGKERKPEDFETALLMEKQSFESAQELRRQLDSTDRSGASSEEITRLKQDWTNHLNEVSRCYDIAMSFASRRDGPKRASPKEIASARLMQAYTHFYLRRNYDAAVLAQFVARTAEKDEENTPVKAALIAMAALVQAYNENRLEPDLKQEEMRMIVKSANLLIHRWPDSENANEARIVLGQIYKSAKKPIEAADWFSKVAEVDVKYPEAQLAAGQAYWSAYGNAARLPKEMRPEPDKFSEWKASAENHLRTGIEKMAAILPNEGAMPQELAIAKISLAEILLSQDKDADAARLLRDDPQSVVKAVAVEDEATRPVQGVQRRPIAKLTYILLLRAYIGMGLDQLENARSAMKTLEAIVASDSTADLTDLYVELGRMLKAELERFRSEGEANRVKKLMTSFESFLNDLLKKQDGQTFGSLSWIGETYFALGEMSADGTRYYDRAATAFSSILTKTAADSNFASPDQLLNVKVRLVRFKRLKKDFDGAEQLLKEVLRQRSNDLRTQVEGASVYQDWGLKGDTQKFIVAITGNKEVGVWGWGGIAKRLQQQKDLADRAELIEICLDARRSVSFCRYHYAKSLSAQEKKKELERCSAELVSSATFMKNIPDDQMIKLEELYQNVLRDLGKPVTKLPRFEVERPSKKDEPEPIANIPTSVDTTPAEKPNETKSLPAVRNEDTTTFAVLVGCLVIGSAIASWVFLNGRRATVKATKTERIVPADSFQGIAFENTVREKFVFSTDEARPRRKPATDNAIYNRDSAPVAKRSGTLGTTGNTPTAKPRPKPPSRPIDE